MEGGDCEKVEGDGENVEVGDGDKVDGDDGGIKEDDREENKELSGEGGDISFRYTRLKYN